ncbi:cytochrome P450 [Spinellus fusiger]|nr:cytochrome P450 [Spinellus fusiger]
MSSFYHSLVQKYSLSNNISDDKALIIAGAISVGTAMYITYSVTKIKEKNTIKEIPMPSGRYPYVGHILQLSDLPHLNMHEWHKELGSIIKVKMGVKDFVVISDPLIAHEVFVKNGSITSSRPYQKFGNEHYGIGGRGIVLSEHGAKWKKARMAANDFLAPKVVNEFSYLLQQQSDILVKQLAEKTSLNGKVYPFDDLLLNSLNLVLTVCFGTYIESTDDPLFTKIIQMIDTSLEMSGLKEDLESYFPFLSFVGYLNNREKRQIQWVNEIRNPIIQSLLDKAIKGDVDCTLKRAYEADNRTRYDNEDLIVIANDLINAGTDTISVTLSWAFAYFSQYPEVQKKICNELDSFIKEYKRLPDFSERNCFPYMIAVQRELFRLFPPTPLGAPRVAEQDFIVSDYLVKEGTALITNVYSIHQNPDYFSEPDKFIPERFMSNTSTMYASANGNIANRDQYNFGWGRRICPGIYLAEIKIFLVYVSVWSQYIVEPKLDSNGKPEYGNVPDPVNGGFVMKPKPYEVRFIERSDKML